MVNSGQAYWWIVGVFTSVNSRPADGQIVAVFTRFNCGPAIFEWLLDLLRLILDH